MTHPQEPGAAPDEASVPEEQAVSTGPFDDETLARLLHDLDVANDWHSGP
ncbi:hypothetical protein LWC35_00850 [Pseudonocardia kujensis]|nr:hypothetical protein [Pseudonocardia kujensis]MCE0761471.1 hypothetical protein [Pseudonocardia kujensis]